MELIKRQAVRWGFFTVGLMVLALGITMMIRGRMMGVGPWDVLAIGLFKNFGLTIGTWTILVGLAIVAVTVVATRRLPKIGTVLNMVLVGVFIDIFNFILPDVPSFAGQLAIFIAGLFTYAYGIGLYVSPQIGAGPRDGLMLFLVEKSGLSIRTVRSLIEVSVALLGWLLGGPVGAGTVIVAFGTGLVAQQSIPQCRALLQRMLADDGEPPRAVRF